MHLILMKKAVEYKTKFEAAEKRIERTANKILSCEIVENVLATNHNNKGKNYV